MSKKNKDKFEIQKEQEEIHVPDKEELRGRRNPYKKRDDRESRDRKFDEDHWN